MTVSYEDMVRNGVIIRPERIEQSYDGVMWAEGTVIKPILYPVLSSRNDGIMSKYIDKVIFNGPATIVYWADGTKTVVKCMPGETFDKEKGLAMAIAKHFLGDLFHPTIERALKDANQFDTQDVYEFRKMKED